MYILQKLCVFPCTAMRTKKIDRYKRNWKLFTNFGQFDAHLGHSGKLYWNVSDHPPNVNYWLFLFYFLLRPAQYPYTYTILQNKYFMKGLFSRARCWYTIAFQFENPRRFWILPSIGIRVFARTVDDMYAPNLFTIKSNRFAFMFSL